MIKNIGFLDNYKMIFFLNQIRVWLYIIYTEYFYITLIVEAFAWILVPWRI